MIFQEFYVTIINSHTNYLLQNVQGIFLETIIEATLRSKIILP